jgi:hypothetical protein
VWSLGNTTHVIIEENLRALREISRATLAPQEYPNRKSSVCHFDARQRGRWMRRDDQPLKDDAETTGYTFHFQISNGGGRKACSVEVQAPSMQDATEFFRQNWPTIETMARDGLADTADDSRIKLVVP